MCRAPNYLSPGRSLTDQANIQNFELKLTAANGDVERTFAFTKAQSGYTFDTNSSEWRRRGAAAQRAGPANALV